MATRPPGLDPAELRPTCPFLSVATRTAALLLARDCAGLEMPRKAQTAEDPAEEAPDLRTAALLLARDCAGLEMPRKAQTAEDPAEDAPDLTDFPPPTSWSFLVLFGGRA